MKIPLRVLSVEDNEDDWLLLQRVLEKGGFEITSVRVERAAAMEAALKGSWDVVISDFHMPEFDTLSALRVLQASGQDLPFIIVSGTVGEEAAIQALKAGAHDFILKGQWTRLVPAITRELREAGRRQEQRRIATALAESERRYREIVETAQEGFWTLDPAGRTTYANPRMLELLSAPLPEVLGRSIRDMVRDPAALAALWMSGGAVRQMPIEIARPNGSSFWASVSAAPVAAESGVLLGTLATVVDITAQRHLTEQLIVSDRMASVGALAAGVAHEINNPLAVIVSNVALAQRALMCLASQGPTPPEIQTLGEELTDVAEAARRVREIARDLKLFSRGGDEPIGPVDLARVVESAARMAQIEVRHRARVVNQIPDLPLVEGVESRLAQVVVNLLVNAAQAIPEGQAELGTIQVSARREADSVCLEISDTGTGMPPVVLQRLFTAFFTTKPVGIGTGLGLSICHRIVTSFGGTISASSVLGKGSTFLVKLRVSPEPRIVPRAAAQRPVGTMEPGRVLVVDDEPTIGAVLRRLLGAAMRVECCSSARQALDRLGSGEQYDIVLCDLMMPGMNGRQFLEALRGCDAVHASRVVFLTGGVFSAEMQQFIQTVPTPVLEKPFDLDRVQAVVNEAVLRARGAPRGGALGASAARPS
jgi:PAS domain S-box-containing protein